MLLEHGSDCSRWDLSDSLTVYKIPCLWGPKSEWKLRVLELFFYFQVHLFGRLGLFWLAISHVSNAAVQLKSLGICSQQQGLIWKFPVVALVIATQFDILTVRTLAHNSFIFCCSATPPSFRWIQFKVAVFLGCFSSWNLYIFCCWPFSEQNGHIFELFWRINFHLCLSDFSGIWVDG